MALGKGNIHALPLLSIPQEPGFLGFFSRLIENFLLRNKFLIQWEDPEKVLMPGGGEGKGRCLNKEITLFNNIFSAFDSQTVTFFQIFR